MGDLAPWATTATAVLLPLLAIYAYLLNARLRGPHPLLRPDTTPPEAEWDTLGDYSAVRMTEHFSQTPTQRGYLVVGGSGLLGSWIVKLLLLRGEKHIRIVDVAAPSYLEERREVEFRKTDIADPRAVERVMSEAFPDGTRISVVLHTASIIRYWERLPYLAHLSDRINIDGTENLLSSSSRNGVSAFVYTSTAALSNPKGLFMRLGWGPVTSKADLTAREDVEGTQDHHYCRTKRVADLMTRTWDKRGEGKMRTAVIRPGMTICGPHDVTFGMYLKIAYSRDPSPGVPNLNGNICQHAVNAQDLAAGHILLADALIDPAKAGLVAGEAFLLTGDRALYPFHVTQSMLKHFSRRPIHFTDLAPIVLYAVGHLIEALCLVRYFLLLAVFTILRRPRSAIAPVPAWLGPAGGLQPSAFETALTNVYVDDSKIRKTLGYRNAWTTVQTLRWVVDGFERDWDAEQARSSTANGLADGSPTRSSGVAEGIDASEVAVAAQATESVRRKVA